MHIHYLQHVAFEDAANIAVWAHQRGHRLTHTRLDLDQPLPGPDGHRLARGDGGAHERR